MTPKERAAMQQALEDLIESARLLGSIQAIKGYGYYTEKDAVFERAMYESISTHKATLLEALERPDIEEMTLTQIAARHKQPSKDGCTYCNNPLFAGTKCNNCGREVEQPSQEYQDHLVNQSFDWSAMAAKHQFMEGYRIGLAEMREKCAKVCEKLDLDWRGLESRIDCATAIRAIKFEGDTGFRPVSEMIAEHKQDPKKGAAIKRAEMRKAEQEPVAETIKNNIFKAWGVK